LTLSDFEQLVTEARKNNQDQQAIYEIYQGQGINDERFDQIMNKIAEYGLVSRYKINRNKSIKKANLQLSHKHKKENTLISEPGCISDNRYLSTLMIDENCAEMSDHQTGQHLQGMVLIEAARQMTLAVTEKYFLDKSQRGNMYFVTNSLETTFHKFIFPLDVEMHYEIIKSRGVGTNRNFQVVIKFIQNGEVGTEVRYGFSVLDPNYMITKESQLAQQNLKFSLAA
jgi:A-factor biosynthesis hotdog domain